MCLQGSIAFFVRPEGSGLAANLKGAQKNTSLKLIRTDRSSAQHSCFPHDERRNNIFVSKFIRKHFMIIGIGILRYVRLKWTLRTIGNIL